MSALIDKLDEKTRKILLPMKISNWESIPYSEGLNCPNLDCTNKSYSDDARDIIGWCETPYGFMQVCECKRCFTKYRMHGFPGDKFSWSSFLMSFMPRIERQGGVTNSHTHEPYWFDEKLLENGKTVVIESNAGKYIVLCLQYDKANKSLATVHCLSSDGIFQKGINISLEGCKVKNASVKEEIKLYSAYLKNKEQK